MGGATPRDRDRKTGRRAGRGGVEGRDRVEMIRARKGTSSGPGVPPHPAAKPSFAASRAWKGSGHRRLLIAANRVLPAGSAAAGRARRTEGGLSCNTPSKGSRGAGRSAASPILAARRLGAYSPLPARPPLRDGVPGWGGSPGANLGRRGYHHALAVKTTPSPLPVQPALRSHSAQESFGVPEAPPGPRGPESRAFGPWRRGGKFVRPALGDR